MELLTQIFITVLNMSFKAILPILFVLLWHNGIRLPNARRKWAYIMWVVVALRLMFPSFPQADNLKAPFVLPAQDLMDLFPQTEDFENNYIGEVTALREGDPNYDTVVSAGAEPIEYAGANYVLASSDGSSPAMTIGDLFPALAVVWLCGIGVMVLWNLIAMLRLHKRLEEAVPIEEDVYICDHIDNAFITGLIYYDIYLPSTLTDEQRAHVLAHERAHIRSSDPFFRRLGFLLLCVHWFNPFVWLAFHYAMNDMEATCDENVFTDMDEEDRKSYASTLLQLSTGRIMWAVTPLSFGETHLKQRIKHILEYKAPGTSSGLGVVLMMLYTFATCLTDPVYDSIALTDRTTEIPQAIIALAAQDTRQPPEVCLYLTDPDLFNDFANDVLATPIVAYEPENYPAGILKVSRERSVNGVAVVFYTAEDTGFYYIEHDPPFSDVGGMELSEFDQFLETVQTTHITLHWYSFSP